MTARDPLTWTAGPSQTAGVERALVLLTCGALLTLVVEVTNTSTEPGQALTALGLAGTFALVATAGFRWVRDKGSRARLAYLAVQLPLGMATFAASHTTVGAALLMTVLVMQAVVLFSLPVAVVVIAIVPLGHLGMPLRDGVRAAVGSVVATGFGAVLAELLVREARARAELAEAHTRLRGYAAQAEELATTQERNRVARDIHDGLGHHLTVVQMQLQAARAVLTSETARSDALLTKAQQQVEEALAGVRRSVSALRDPEVARPLTERLEDLVTESSSAGIATVFQVAGTARTLSAETAEALYRTAQEGLTNVRKHAGASNAWIVLDYRKATSVALEVGDDGRGTTHPEAGRGYGLVGVRERAERLGGRLELDSSPGGGVRLRAEVPG